MTAPASTRTCYRHPDRAAGISCQRCERPICPSCMHQASVGFHCPECAKAGRQKVLQGRAAWTSRPVVTQVLVGITVVSYALITGTLGIEPFSRYGRFLHSQDRPGGLFADIAVWGPAVPDEPWRLVAGGLVDPAPPYGLVGLVFTVLLLLRFGLRLEPIVGPAGIASLAAVGLTTGSLAVMALDSRSVTTDASGIVFGIVGGTLVVARDRDLDLWRFGLPLVVFRVFVALSGSYATIAFSLGGFLGGLIGGVLLTEGARRLGRRGDLAAAALTGLVALVTLGLAYVRAVGEFG